jgi:putative transposase
MRQSHPSIGLGKLCTLFGVTRQAYYEAQAREIKTNIAHSIVLVLVKETRDIMPSIGTRKLIHEIGSQLRDQGIKMGRDQLFDLLRFHGLLVRRRKRGMRTTDSSHWLKKYPNLIVALDLTSPEQLWVSDITYVRTMEGYSYLSLITDAYSRKIVGHALHPSLESEGCIIALTMALDGRLYRDSLLIHHSDRGVQYCCSAYVDILLSQGIAISMTQSGNPYENALAERMNGRKSRNSFQKGITKTTRRQKKRLIK